MTGSAENGGHDDAPLVNDARFTLTEWERESVERLKDECDKHSVEYKSLFELAKYVLVVQSSVEGNAEKDEQKRLSLAFERIKGRREWEKRIGIDKEDPLEALLQYEVLSPGFLIFAFDKDHENHAILAYSKFHCNPKAIKENKASAYAGFLCWYDLAAADMEEARRGLAIATMARQTENMTNKTTRLWNYVNACAAMKDVMKPIHNHRVRRIYSTAPITTRVFIDMIKKILPRKLKDRIQTFASQEDLEEVLYPCEKGDRSLSQWVAERSAIFQETVEKLSL